MVNYQKKYLKYKKKYLAAKKKYSEGGSPSQPTLTVEKSVDVLTNWLKNAEDPNGDAWSNDSYKTVQAIWAKDPKIIAYYGASYRMPIWAKTKPEERLIIKGQVEQILFGLMLGDLNQKILSKSDELLPEKADIEHILKVFENLGLANAHKEILTGDIGTDKYKKVLSELKPVLPDFIENLDKYSDDDEMIEMITNLLSKQNPNNIPKITDEEMKTIIGKEPAEKIIQFIKKISDNAQGKLTNEQKIELAKQMEKAQNEMKGGAEGFLGMTGSVALGFCFVPGLGWVAGCTTFAVLTLVTLGFILVRNIWISANAIRENEYYKYWSQ